MKGKFRSQITVVGGGPGGLAAAIRLAAAGCQVTVLERNARVGGKMNALEWHGFHWDTGPTLLTMPQVLADLWSAVGAKLDDDIDLMPMPETCRYRWQDGTVINADAAFWARPEVAAFLRHAKGYHDPGAITRLDPPPAGRQNPRTAGNLPGLRQLWMRLDPRSLARVNAGIFPRSPHLQQVFNSFATCRGSSPYAAPAALQAIPYSLARFGGWYPRGGMVAIAAAMENLALRQGVTIETGEEVARLQENSGRWTVFHRPTAGGAVRPRQCDGIVCNMDALAATRAFLDPSFEPRQPLSMSGFMIHAAVARTYPDLGHHNTLFSSDYPREFRGIFTTGDPVGEPTVSIAISAKSDATRAPAGCENWSVLVNAPALKPGIEWPVIAARYADAILGGLTRHGVDDPRPHIRWMRIVTPEDFSVNHLAMGGSFHGYASHSLFPAGKRPAIASGRPGLVFAGGSTRPGGGIPAVVLSGQLAASTLLTQLGRAPHPPATATPAA